MSDLISRAYVKNALNINDKKKRNEHFLNGIEMAKKIVDNAPNIDAEPVRHGYWIDNGYVQHYPQFIDDKLTDAPARMLICSECGSATFHMKKPYCPYCGVKMDVRNLNYDFFCANGEKL